MGEAFYPSEQRELAAARPRARRARHVAPAVRVRAVALVFHQGAERRPGDRAFQPAGLLVEPADRLQLLVASETRLADRLLENGNGLVVHAQRDGEGMTVLAAVREREPRRVGEAA